MINGKRALDGADNTPAAKKQAHEAKKDESKKPPAALQTALQQQAPGKVRTLAAFSLETFSFNEHVMPGVDIVRKTLEFKQPTSEPIFITVPCHGFIPRNFGYHVFRNKKPKDTDLVVIKSNVDNEDTQRHLRNFTTELKAFLIKHRPNWQDFFTPEECENFELYSILQESSAEKKVPRRTAFAPIIALETSEKEWSEKAVIIEDRAVPGKKNIPLTDLPGVFCEELVFELMGVKFKIVEKKDKTTNVCGMIIKRLRKVLMNSASQAPEAVRPLLLTPSELESNPPGPNVKHVVFTKAAGFHFGTEAILHKPQQKEKATNEFDEAGEAKTFNMTIAPITMLDGATSLTLLLEGGGKFLSPAVRTSEKFGSMSITFTVLLPTEIRALEQCHEFLQTAVVNDRVKYFPGDFHSKNHEIAAKVETLIDNLRKKIPQHLNKKGLSEEEEQQQNLAKLAFGQEPIKPGDEVWDRTMRCSFFVKNLSSGHMKIVEHNGVLLKQDELHKLNDRMWDQVAVTLVRAYGKGGEKVCWLSVFEYAKLAPPADRWMPA